VPASIKLQEEYGDDLAVLFVESQGTSPEDTARFIMKQRWFGNATMWTNERPFETGSNGLPNFALVSSDGRILAKGSSPTSRDKDLIEEEIAAAKGAPPGTPKALEKAWKSFNNGSIAKAIEEARKLGEKKPDLAADAEVAAQQFEARVQSRLARVTWLIENGYPVEAKDQLETLTKDLKGAGELLASATELEARFDEDSVKLELEAGQTLGRALDKLFEDGRDEKLFDKVTQLAEKYAGTKVAERALQFAALRS
jgi:hypothetical protein